MEWCMILIQWDVWLLDGIDWCTMELKIWDSTHCIEIYMLIAIAKVLPLKMPFFSLHVCLCLCVSACNICFYISNICVRYMYVWVFPSARFVLHGLIVFNNFPLRVLFCMHFFSQFRNQFLAMYARYVVLFFMCVCPCVFACEI